MSIYFRSSMGIDFPKAPYIGQVRYDFDLKRTFRYEEKPPEMALWTLDMFHWVDITEKTYNLQIKRNPVTVKQKSFINK